MTKNQKVTTITAITLAVVLVVSLVMYGILSGSSSDPQYLRGCRAEDGTLDTERDCFQADWVDTVKAPLIVSGANAQPWQRAALESAIKKVNAEAGFNLFLYIPNEAPMIRVLFNQQVSVQTVAARTILMLDAKRDKVVYVDVVSFDTVEDQDVMELVLRHELGHAVTLAHDSDPTSIMHLPPMVGATLERSDAKFLKGRFGS